VRVRPVTSVCRIADPDTGHAAVSNDQILSDSRPLKADVALLETGAINRFDKTQPLASSQMEPWDRVPGRPCEILEREVTPQRIGLAC
jgi:hypothetical protein